MLVLAAVLAVIAAVLVNPLRGTIVGLPTVALGPSLLLRALAAALVGRMTSLPKALAGGVAVGVAEAVIFSNIGSPGAVDALMPGFAEAGPFSATRSRVRHSIVAATGADAETRSREHGTHMSQDEATAFAHAILDEALNRSGGHRPSGC